MILVSFLIELDPWWYKGCVVKLAFFFSLVRFLKYLSLTNFKIFFLQSLEENFLDRLCNAINIGLVHSTNLIIFNNQLFLLSVKIMTPHYNTCSSI